MLGTWCRYPQQVTAPPPLAPVPVHPSATVLVVRPAPIDGHQIEVLLLQRNHRGTFVAGATLYPGGALDPDDAHVRTVPHQAQAAGGGDDEGWATTLRMSAVAAARECFEEAGVLLAANDDGSWASSSQVSSLASAFAAGLSFSDSVHAAGLHVPVIRFLPWGRWVTPIGASRRYDTTFFVVGAPVHHEVRVDGVEIVGAAWWSPAAALDAEAAGEMRLVTPTRKTLERLAAHDSVHSLGLYTGDPVDPVDPGDPVDLGGGDGGDGGDGS